MSIDPNRLRFLEEDLARRRGALNALQDRQTDAQAKSREVLHRAQRDAEQLRSHGPIATLADVAEANRLSIEVRKYPLIPQKDLDDAIAAGEYAADLRRRIAAATKGIDALGHLVNACRKVVHGEPDFIAGFNNAGQVQR